MPNPPGTNLSANDWLSVAMLMAGGLALFLFGLSQLTDSLKAAGGAKMRAVLARLTTNRWAALFSGLFVTSLTQSSSVTTVLLIGFVSAGLLSLQQSIGVILGADIASTFTAQIIAFEVDEYALVPIALGFAMMKMLRRHPSWHIGRAVFALGLIFFGVGLMGNGAQPLSSSSLFTGWMTHLRTPWVGVAVGAILTAVVQSSGATLGLLIVLGSAGLITLDAAIAVAFGANIGTCFTAIIASIGHPREAKQVAVAHTLIKIIGVAVWYAFIPQLVQVTQWISPSYESLSGSERLAAEMPRQIANAHTIFNVINAMLLIWIAGPFARVIGFLIRPKPGHEGERVAPMYLDSAALSTPDIALDRIRLETARLGGFVIEAINRVGWATFAAADPELKSMAREQRVSQLETAIIEFVRDLTRRELSKDQARRVRNALNLIDHLDNINDIVRANFVMVGRRRIRHGVRFSDDTLATLRALFARARHSVELAVDSLEENRPDVAKQVIDMKREIEALSNDAMDRLSQRLLAEEPNRTQTFRVEADYIAQARRMYHHARRIAKIILATPLVEEVEDADAADMS